MPYTQFDYTTPNPATQGIVAYSTSIRTNLAAIRDIALTGAAPGWNYSWSGGTADKPTYMIWSKGVERVRVTCTWGTTGGATDNLTVGVFAYSSNSGTSYDTIGTETLAYDANSNLTSTTWS